MASPPPPSSSDSRNVPLRIVFMGTPALAAHVLDRLIAASSPIFTVVGVVTRPDQPRKRGLKLEPSEVGAVAASHGLPTLKPSKIRTPAFLAELQAFAPDLLVVVAYGRLLPNPVLAAARLMPLNLHASLLPHHRGASPIEAALLAGDRQSGVTIMRITERMDSGPILLQRALDLAPDESQGSLKAKLAALGADTLIKALTMLHHGALTETPQDEALATYCSPVTKTDALIDWSGDAVQIERIVRAYDPWPIARTRFGGEDLLIWQASVVPSLDATGAPPGTIVQLSPQPVVRCGIGSLALDEIQAPGRRRMAAADFFRGRRIAAGSRLGT